MKKILSLTLCLALIIAMAVPALATDNSEVIFSELTTLEDGTVIKSEVIVISHTRSTDKTAVRKNTITRSDTVIGIIAFQATFRYDGSTVSVVSKSVTQTDTYEGWSYKQGSFTSSGGTVTLEGKLTKWLILNSSFSMSLICDKNGTLSN